MTKASKETKPKNSKETKPKGKKPRPKKLGLDASKKIGLDKKSLAAGTRKAKSKLGKNLAKKTLVNQKKWSKKKKQVLAKDNNGDGGVLFSLPKIKPLMLDRKGKKKKNNENSGKIDNSEEKQTKKHGSPRCFRYITAMDHSCVHGLLLMHKSMEVPITGKFILEVVKGIIDIFGCEFISGQISVPVFSSKSSAVFKLTDMNGENCELSAEQEEQIKDIFREKSDEALKSIKRFSSAVLIMKLSESCSILYATKFKQYQKIFPDPPVVYNKKDPLVTAIETKKWDPLVSDVAKKSVNSPNFVVLICGSKNTGKSTFGRFLLNTLLNHHESVYFLECDVGQTEFTPPGIISLSCIKEPLLGAPFTHQTRPVVSFFFGDITPRNNPKAYAYCIREAFHFYHHNCRGKGPLIINTQGWIKGIGFSLLIDVIRISNPSMVLHLKNQSEIETPPKNSVELRRGILKSQPGWISSPYEQPMDYDESMLESRQEGSSAITNVNHTSINKKRYRKSSTKFVSVPAYEGSAASVSALKAVDYRRLALLAYFGNMFDKDGVQGQAISVDRPLEYFVPRIVYWKDVAVHVLHCKVPPSMIMLSLNFSVVSLAIVNPDNIIELSQDILPDGPKFLRENSVATHVGFGFVRNIDISRKCFIIITPECETSLKQVNAILKGAVDLPIGVFNQNSSSAVYCTTQQHSAILGASARKPRFNLKRRKFESPGKPACTIETGGN